MPGIGNYVRWLLMLAVLSCSALPIPLRAQQVTDNQNQLLAHLQLNLVQDQVESPPSALDSRFSLMSAGPQSYISLRPRSYAFAFERQVWTSSPGTIQRMESAFYCNDTPFVDQLRLPLATFWGGRVKLDGFESDVTTANFVMGLPGQGALHNLSAFGGNGFLAVHTPPSDQLAGIHMTFSWHASEADSGDSSGLHGIEHLVHASRAFLPFLSGRSDSSSTALP